MFPNAPETANAATQAPITYRTGNILVMANTPLGSPLSPRPRSARWREIAFHSLETRRPNDNKTQKPAVMRSDGETEDLSALRGAGSRRLLVRAHAPSGRTESAREHAPQ